MEIILATSLGMCFGVRDALAAAHRVPHPAATTIHGELVHNPLVLTQLHLRGFPITRESHRAQIPASPHVLITAHGISHRERNRLAAAGKHLIDTTCPLVRKAHDAAQALAAESRHILLIGKRGHVEVEGIAGDLDSCTILASPAEVTSYPYPRLGIVCQTTTAQRDADAIRTAIAQRNPRADIRFINTICQPTRDRQRAMEELLDQVDAVVVLGGRNSNNTRKLVERSAERGIPAYHVESAAEIEPEWFSGCRTVGLTAGTSTLPETITEVHDALRRIALLHSWLGGVALVEA